MPPKATLFSGIFYSFQVFMAWKLLTRPHFDFDALYPYQPILNSMRIFNADNMRMKLDT